MERKENMCQPPECPAEMFAEYFESAKEMALRASEIEAILGDDYDLERLKELVEADRDGRCVVLPLKIFDKVWDTIAHHQFEIIEIDLLPYGKIMFRCGNKGTDDYTAFYDEDLGGAFTLREPPERTQCAEAEAALKAREQKHNV